MQRAAAALLLPAAAAHDFSLHTGAAGVKCNYAVDQQAVKVTGTIPAHLNGSYYHAVSDTGIDKNADSNGVGGVIAVHFSPGETPTASFGMVRGSGWFLKCPLHAKPPIPTMYAGDCAITVSGVSGNDTVAVVCAMPHLTALDSKSLKTVEVPVKFDGSLGPKQNAFPPELGPSFFAPGHLVTDASGDTYGSVYIFEQVEGSEIQTGYRVYRVDAGTRKRTVLADVPAHPQFGGKGPAYVHQALALTPSFVIIPESPMLMPNATFDWGQIQDGWMPDGKLVFRVLDKATGKELGTYDGPNTFSWHGVNAWENDTHITFDLSVTPGAHALDVFTGRGNASGVTGSLSRATMPNPKHAAAPATGAAVLTPLTTAPGAFTAEFGVVNPAHMWQRPTRWVWALALDAARAATQSSFAWPSLLKLDTETGTQEMWSPPEYLGISADGLGAPIFVPAALDQPADSDAGSVLVLSMGADSPVIHIVDGTTNKEVARLDLPMSQFPSVGLHNHFSTLPSSV